MFTIEPLVVAYGPHREKSRFTYMHNAGVPVDIPYVSWLLRSNDLTVLVDVGCSADDYARYIRPVDRELVHVGQVFADVIDVRPLEHHLQNRGLSASDVDIVVLTHLDWDHCMTIDPFERSKFLLQRREWDNTPSHPMFTTSYAPAEHYQRLERDFDLDLVDGNRQLADGLELLLTPGHTHGGQSLLVDTSEGRYVIAGMCVLKENFYPSKEEVEHFEVIPPGGHTDLFQAYDWMRQLKELAGSNVLPLHMTEAFHMSEIKSVIGG